MEFPLTLSFKIVSLASQIHVTDASGQSVCYVRQKMFKLKEAVEVFTDSTKSAKIADIQADRIIDFSAKYTITDSNGNVLGAIKRRGMRSFWKTHYEISVGDEVLLEIREENPWAKVADSFFGEIPILGAFAGYLFHPKFVITRVGTGEEIMRIRKQPAFFEGRFTLEKLADLDTEQEVRAVLSVMMMALLERKRG